MNRVCAKISLIETRDEKYKQLEESSLELEMLSAKLMRTIDLEMKTRNLNLEVRKLNEIIGSSQKMQLEKKRSRLLEKMSFSKQTIEELNKNIQFNSLSINEEIEIVSNIIQEKSNNVSDLMKSLEINNGLIIEGSEIMNYLNLTMKSLFAKYEQEIIKLQIEPLPEIAQKDILTPLIWQMLRPIPSERLTASSLNHVIETLANDHNIS